jgi:hypothetical protein
LIPFLLLGSAPELGVGIARADNDEFFNGCYSDRGRNSWIFISGTVYYRHDGNTDKWMPPVDLTTNAVWSAVNAPFNPAEGYYDASLGRHVFDDIDGAVKAGVHISVYRGTVVHVWNGQSWTRVELTTYEPWRGPNAPFGAGRTGRLDLVYTTDDANGTEGSFWAARGDELFEYSYAAGVWRPVRSVSATFPTGPNSPVGGKMGCAIERLEGDMYVYGGKDGALWLYHFDWGATPVPKQYLGRGSGFTEPNAPLAHF